MDREAGDVTQAKTGLWKLWNATPDDEVQRLLVSTIIAELKREPQRWQELFAEITLLLKTPDQRSPYLRQFAAAADHNGRPLDALRLYLQFRNDAADDDVAPDDVAPDDIAPDDIAPDDGGPRRLVRRDRYTQGMLFDLFQHAAVEDRNRIDAAMRKHLQGADDNRDSDDLQEFADRFSQLSWGRRVRTTMAADRGLGSEFLKWQLALIEISGVNQRDLAAAALKELAKLMSARSYHSDAQAVRGRLQSEFQDVPSVQQDPQLRSGAGSDVKAKEGSADRWPSSVPTTASEPRRNDDIYFDRVPVTASRGSLLDRLSVYVQRQGNAVRFQGDGQFGYWRLDLPKRPAFSFRHSDFRLSRGWGIGHLLILRVGTELFAISPLDENGESNARLLWTVDTFDDTYRDTRVISRPHGVRSGFGADEFVLHDRYGREVAGVGPVRAGYVCYRQKAKLIAVETRTGYRIWQRFDIPAGCRVVGDDEHVILWRADDPQIEVLRVIDGKTVAVVEGNTPPPQVLIRRGRSWITEVSANDSRGYGLRAVDVVQQRTEWERWFLAGSRPFAIDLEMIGLLEPNGKMHFVLARTGQSIDAGIVNVPEKLEQIYCEVDQYRVFVVLSGAMSATEHLRVQQVRGGYRNPWVNGRLVGCDRMTGQQFWQRDLKDKAFPLDQSNESPLLVLNYRRLKDRSAPNQQIVGVLECLDKRTGKQLYESLGDTLNVYHFLESKFPHRTVDLHLRKETLRFNFDPQAESKEPDEAEAKNQTQDGNSK